MKLISLTLAILLTACHPAQPTAEVRFALAVEKCKSLGQEPTVSEYYGRLMVTGCSRNCSVLEIKE